MLAKGPCGVQYVFLYICMISKQTLMFPCLILKVSTSYEYIPQAFVEEFVKACRICAGYKAFPPKIAAKPIQSTGFLDRLQVDLICFTHMPDRAFKYICHVRDHFSRFSWARALTSKRPREVALFLFEIFTIFGAPVILHSDNGKEFVAKVIRALLKLWATIKIVNGRPRHPQSQGCVERGNKVLQERLGKWMAASNSTSWSTGLPIVICKYYVLFGACLPSNILIVYLFVFIYLDTMNVTICRSTNCSPYKLVFGQDPLVRFALLDEMERHTLSNEEEVPNNLINELQLYNDDTFNDIIDEENVSEPLLNGIFEDNVSNLFEKLRQLELLLTDSFVWQEIASAKSSDDHVFTLQPIQDLDTVSN